MVGRVRVVDSAPLRRTIDAIAGLDAATQADIRSQTNAGIGADWRRQLAREATTVPESRVLADTSNVSASNSNITVIAGRGGQVLSGGGVASELAPAIEFGANQAKTATYRSRRRGGAAFDVTRHTTRQLRSRNRSGYVFYPAAADMIPRALALWSQTVVRRIHLALEGRRG